MSDIFGGIFDTLANDVSGLFDNVSATGLAGAAIRAGQGLVGQPKNISVSSLNNGFLSPNNDVRAGKSSPAQAADPYAVERVWNDRLETFAKIKRQTSVDIPKQGIN